MGRQLVRGADHLVSPAGRTHARAIWNIARGFGLSFGKTTSL